MASKLTVCFTYGRYILNRRYFLLGSIAVGAVAAFSRWPLAASLTQMSDNSNNRPKAKGVEKVSKTDAEWKQILTPEQYQITREKGTERPFSSPLNDIHEKGTFECVACGLPLFRSKAKFDSGTGWPSFYEPIAKESVREETDKSLWATRTEVLCARCDAHLGHVFDDGPNPTGLRYCMNGVALKFKKE
ncbi:MAG: peptide-methionine (R)-S-oxide reductase MsrB [Acidobacteriota bacterium]